jgi:hypothetical protein
VSVLPRDHHEGGRFKHLKMNFGMKVIGYEIRLFELSIIIGQIKSYVLWYIFQSASYSQRRELGDK